MPRLGSGIPRVLHFRVFGNPYGPYEIPKRLRHNTFSRLPPAMPSRCLQRELVFVHPTIEDLVVISSARCSHQWQLRGQG